MYPVERSKISFELSVLVQCMHHDVSNFVYHELPPVYEVARQADVLFSNTLDYLQNKQSSLLVRLLVSARCKLSIVKPSITTALARPNVNLAHLHIVCMAACGQNPGSHVHLQGCGRGRLCNKFSLKPSHNGERFWHLLTRLELPP